MVRADGQRNTERIGTGCSRIADELKQYLRAHEEDIVKFLAAFIQHASEAPKGRPATVKSCMDWLYKELVGWGWRPYLDMWEVAPGEPNLVVRLPGSSGEPCLMFNGHADVAPVEAWEKASWTFPPYGGAIADGRVWGRGASDMKGGVTAFLWAARAVQAVCRDLAHDLLLAVNVGEESARPEIGIRSVLERGYRASLVINAEPTNLKVCNAGPGWFFFEVEVTGKATHPANRYLCLDEGAPATQRVGVDAARKLCKVMEALDALEQEWHQGHGVCRALDAPLLTCVQITGGDRAARMIDSARAVYAVVFPWGYRSETVIRAISECVNRVSASDAWLKEVPPRITVPVIDPIWEPFSLELSHPGLVELKEAAEEVLGADVPVVPFPSPSDANETSAAGCATLVFGPGDLSYGCHGRDEFIPVEQLLAAAEVYARLIAKRCCRVVS